MLSRIVGGRRAEAQQLSLLVLICFDVLLTLKLNKIIQSKFNPVSNFTTAKRVVLVTEIHNSAYTKYPSSTSKEAVNHFSIFFASEFSFLHLTGQVCEAKVQLQNLLPKEKFNNAASKRQGQMTSPHWKPSDRD